MVLFCSNYIALGFVHTQSFPRVCSPASSVPTPTDDHPCDEHSKATYQDYLALSSSETGWWEKQNIQASPHHSASNKQIEFLETLKERMKNIPGENLVARISRVFFQSKEWLHKI